MKQITLLLTFSIIGIIVKAQNYVGTPLGVYAQTYNSATVIGAGGHVLVGNSGNWVFGGNVVSMDKGGPNAPNDNGRSESIVFDGDGTYSNAATNSGASGNIIDGYAGAQNKNGAFKLPIGEGSQAFPLTVPVGASTIAAYFTGLGSEQSSVINGVPVITYSPYFDVDNLSADSYIFGFPPGMSIDPYNVLLESGNTSANGTGSATSYSDVQGDADYDDITGSVLADVSSSYGPTQVYLGGSAIALPVGLIDFKGNYVDHAVLLSWKTTFEANNKGFNVQRSSDGVHFVNVGFVASLKAESGGNSTTTLNYSYKDILNVAGEKVYYRLEQLGLDNARKTSVTIDIPLQGNVGQIKIYPNPTSGKFKVLGLVPGSQLLMINGAGQKVKSWKISADNVSLDASDLRTGVYYLQVISKNGVVTNSTLLIK